MRLTQVQGSTTCYVDVQVELGKLSGARGHDWLHFYLDRAVLGWYGLPGCMVGASAGCQEISSLLKEAPREVVHAYIAPVVSELTSTCTCCHL